MVYGGQGPVKSFLTLTAKVFRFYAPTIIVNKKVSKESFARSTEGTKTRVGKRRNRENENVRENNNKD